MKKVLFGIRVPNSGPLASIENIKKIAVEAESLGFDSLEAHDHVSFGRNERYHFSGGTAEQVDENERRGVPVTTFYESVTLFSYLAGLTHRIRFVPSAWVLPWRHPVLLAKQAVTLHELSGGRLVFCVTLGNFRPDFNSMGVPWKLKGRIMNEYLDVLRQIFSGEKTISYKGNYISISDLDFYPRPKNLPIWIGGTSSKAYERIAKYGTGWLAGGESPEDYRTALPELGEKLKNYNRTLEEIELGHQTFLRLGSTTDNAFKEARHTISGFFGGKEFADTTEQLIQRAFKNSFVGSPSDIVSVTQAYLDVGVTFHDIRLVAADIDEAITMIRNFEREVLRSFK